MSENANIRLIEEGQFDAEVMAAPGPVVLDFFSTECPPCEALAPKYAALAEQFGDRVQFLKVFRQGKRRSLEARRRVAPR
jgi:thiol-disulfide isomerase/thioredoxin